MAAHDASQFLRVIAGRDRILFTQILRNEKPMTFTTMTPRQRVQMERLKNWKIDIALLPINGRDLARGLAGNFSAEQAARLGKQIHAGLVVPCHYEMFEFNTVSPEGFARAAQERGQNYRILKCGERPDL
jgi:hypothetical protein